jgi:dipeptidyl aminopeptidase/acylaminoacyl peptidase
LKRIHRRLDVKTILRVALAVVLFPAAAAAEDKLLTVAEKSDFQATSHHAEVVDFCERLAKASPVVRLGVLGKSYEGRKLPLLILADPPVSTPEEAAKSGKLVVFAQANIHAGEVDAKEGYLMLAREIALGPERRLLQDLVVVLAPIFNADGNDRFGPIEKNRRNQNGPIKGAGVRHNAQDLDLNRDWIKLESPEDRALVHFLDRWKPVIWIDGHTTNGSYHRYVMTYETPKNPAGDPHIVEYARDKMLPDVSERLEKLDGYRSFFYVDHFSPDHKVLTSVPPTPRFSTHYAGLRNIIGILSESYSYAPYKDRCLASRDFARCIFEYAADHKDEIRKLIEGAGDATVGAGRKLGPENQIALRLKQEPLDKVFTFLGFVEEVKNGRHVPTKETKDYQLRYMGRAVPALSVQRPYAYLVPAELAKVVQNLQRHGIAVQELREDIELDVEVQRVDKIVRAPRPARGQNHLTVQVTTSTRKESRRVPAGTMLVKTAQPLGNLAAYLLEPQSEDGLTTWNFFDDQLGEGKDFPVLRLMSEVPITSGDARPLPDDRVRNKPITFDDLYARRPLDFGGNPVSGIEWLEDGEHFLQSKEGRLYKVHAVNGRCELFFDPARIAQALPKAPTGRQRMGRRVRIPGWQMNPQHTGVLVEAGGDLYHVPIDGGKPVRVSKALGRKELASFSPDGKHIAFVCNGDLYASDVATGEEHKLTSDGGKLVSNGKPDWVYGEEIYDYQKTYWWSPDSGRIAFLRCDDRPVPTFTIINNVPSTQDVEATPYPRSGEPNPLMRLGVVAAAGGRVHWIDLGGDDGNRLITRAGWMPDGQRIYFYVQDRAQTWLDFMTAPPDGGSLTRLFRDTTAAWVADPGDANFLKDGTFLIFSERTGWKHLYHYDASGKLLGAVTSGPWEARELNRVDERAGWIYVSGTRDTSLASSLYRFRLDGSGGERLTSCPGDHQVTVSPKGGLFVDSCSSHTDPTKVSVRGGDQGFVLRTLDTNPVYIKEEYRLGNYQPVQIATPDGFVLEASLLTPPDFDPSRRYPVWFMTYGGPHAPTLRDNWQGGRVADQLLANLGFVVFRADPRSASGKGACSTWTAYRRLGIGELKDIETAIGWLVKQPYVDAARIGMSGHSYGGFMTSFALTHSKLFAAGIAGAPVTDWKSYDTIYTERYMNTPRENPKGYADTSVLAAADRLHGKLLILHGLFDDNVHVQNSIQLIDRLQRADKSFEVMFYPRSRHGISGVHYHRLMIDFMCKALGVSFQGSSVARK